MSTETTDNQRVTVDGKFFRLGEEKFHVKGVTYGPFPPNADSELYPSKEQAAKDLRHIHELGANTLRVYHVPPVWFLDLLTEHGLKVLIDIPWWKTGCFLDSPKTIFDARLDVVNAVKACAGHAAVFAFSLVNEIAPDVVRWHGEKAVGRFIDELADLVHELDPGCLVTFGNYPPTEYLLSKRIDFLMFNVYLHEQEALQNYTSHLQMLADAKPLVFGELGIDSRAEGETEQAEILSWQIETVFRSGAAGALVYSYTDEWYKDGRLVEGWKFGLVTAERKAKPALDAVRSAYAVAPYYELKSAPRVSVVVATYNGGKTLRICLRSLCKLNYPDFEIIVIDDGSTDDVPEIAQSFDSERVKYIRQENQGLSAARNAGMNAATGEIVAYTDDDCRADEDWLYFLAADLADSEFVAMGGHNFLPPEDSATAAAVMAAPGGPIHVMLTAREAEHIPGCNMAFRKDALEEIGGFDPVYRKAGDDVDVCWRLQDTGHKIGFNPVGFVWHYRRSTVEAYLKQQSGYGEAEALLQHKHPDKFSPDGGGRWRGRIYAPANWFSMGAERIYRGTFGEGLFQTIYSRGMSRWLASHTSLERQVFITLPLVLLALVFDNPILATLAVLAVGSWLGVIVYAGIRSDVPPKQRRWWSRPLVSLLYLLQPIFRSWARYKELFGWQLPSLHSRETLDTLSSERKAERFETVSYWSETPLPRGQLLQTLLERLRAERWQAHADEGWSDHDLEVAGSRWCRLRLTTVNEWHKGGRVMLRCRVNTSWSPLARMALYFVLLGVIVLEGLPMPAVWKGILPCLMLPGIVLWVRQREQKLRRIFSVVLDQVAAKEGWQQVGSQMDAPVNNAASTAPAAPVYAPEWFSIWNCCDTF
ncbi:MAG: glycosyltransferase [Limisphaerales bacterium]